MRALDAKVSARLVAVAALLGAVVVGGWGALAASELGEEKGFKGAAEEVLENGFDAEGADAEKGFVPAFKRFVEFPPKIALPRSRFGVNSAVLCAVDGPVFARSIFI